MPPLGQLGGFPPGSATPSRPTRHVPGEEQGEEQLVRHLRQKYTATAVALDAEQKSKETEVSPGVGVDKVMIY